MESSDMAKRMPAIEPTMEVAARPAAPEPGGTEGNAMLRFTLVTGAWFVGLFGLMRLPWVERVLLTPFAEVQQRVADQLTGAPSDLVYADASCSGGDPLALCAGAIFAFPAAWGARLRGAAVGFTLITAVNIVRLGHLSLIAENRALLDLLHVYVWPGILILVAAGFVYGWMGRQGFGADVASFGGLALGVAARRFLVLAALLVAAYFATAPFFYESPAVDVIAGWIAVTGGAILAAAGTTAAVSGAVIRTAHGGFVVTQECIFTPLIPLYVAATLSAPMGWGRRRTAMLASAVAAFAAAPLLGAVVGGAAGGLQALAGHAGHAFTDEQGAWAILPAFQAGLFTALWIAVAGGGRSWRRALAGLCGVVLVQAAFGVPVGRLRRPSIFARRKLKTDGQHSRSTDSAIKSSMSTSPYKFSQAGATRRTTCLSRLGVSMRSRMVSHTSRSWSRRTSRNNPPSPS